MLVELRVETHPRKQIVATPAWIASSQTGAIGQRAQPPVAEAAIAGLVKSSFMRKVRVSFAVLINWSRRRRTCVLPWIAQSIVSGVTGHLGMVAQLHVEREHKIAPVRRPSLQNPEVRRAKEATESGRRVTWRFAHWTVNGEIGVSGATAAEPVTAGHNSETGPLYLQSRAKVATVMVTLRRTDLAAKKLVLVIACSMTGRNGQSVQPHVDPVDDANAYGMLSLR